MDLKLSNVVNWTHSVIDFLLTQRRIDSVVVTLTFIFIQISIVKLLIQNATEGEPWVEFDPRWSEHEVDVTLELVAPEFDNTTQVELADDVVRLDQCVHVGSETVLRVYTLLVKLNLDEGIRVGTDDKVYLSPIDHDNFLDVVHDVGKLSRRQSLQTAVLLRRSKVTIQDLLLVEPLGAENLLFTGLIGVVMHEVRHHIVLLFFFRQEAVMILPVVLVHSHVESFAVANGSLLALLLLPLILFMFEEHRVLIWQPLVVAKESATCQSSNLRLRLSPDKVGILLVIHQFSNGIRKKVSW